MIRRIGTSVIPMTINWEQQARSIGVIVSIEYNEGYTIVHIQNRKKEIIRYRIVSGVYGTKLLRTA